MPSNHNKKIEAAAKTGAGLAALAAAAAGAYYFYGSKRSAQHRKALKGWAVKAKGEVMEKLETLEDISKQAYDKTVDQALSKYKALKNIDPKELVALGAELKGHWHSIMKDVGKNQGKTATRTKHSRTKKTQASHQ